MAPAAEVADDEVDGMISPDPGPMNAVLPASPTTRPVLTAGGLGEGTQEHWYEDQVNRAINEEYKTWKKNSPFLYDLIISRALTWPTLTVQWFPDVKEPEGKNYTVHRLLLGTHTADDSPNYLQVAEVQMPKAAPARPENYDEERGEIGGYGKSNSGEMPSVRFDILQRIEHPGEVNKARYQEQNPDLIATLCVDGRILIFDRTRHPLQPGGQHSAELELVGHTNEGFGLSWNPHEEGCLASGSEDKTVLLWDMKGVTAAGKELSPVRRYTHHKQIVNDVQYHPIGRHFIGTVSDDGTLQVVDVRQAETSRAALVAQHGHTDAINALAFNPTSDVLVATASADNTIGLWDLRNVSTRIHVLDGHQDAVTSVSWHPHEAGILGSCSYDRRVIVWDLARVGEEQLPDDQEDGPPELLFMHGGHTNHMTDFSWNLNEPWVVCSAAEDNMLQIWKVAECLVSSEEASVRLDELDR